MPRTYKPVQHEPKPCTYCKSAFTPKSKIREHCYAVECERAHKAKKMREYTAKVRERDGISWRAKRYRAERGQSLDVRECVVCKEPVRLRANSRGFVAHKACEETLPRWKVKGDENPKLKAFRRKMEAAAAGTTGGNRVFVSGPCFWCGKAFTAVGGAYCSGACKTSAKFKRRSSGNTFQISPLERRAIYRRDRWTCQLCQQRVDPDLKNPHIWSATLDHIIPQAHMLIPDHSPSNLRLAHLWCNSARGDGSNMPKEEFEMRVGRMLGYAA